MVDGGSANTSVICLHLWLMCSLRVVLSNIMIIIHHLIRIHGHQMKIRMIHRKEQDRNNYYII